MQIKTALCTILVYGVFSVGFGCLFFAFLSIWSSHQTCSSKCIIESPRVAVSGKILARKGLVYVLYYRGKTKKGEVCRAKVLVTEAEYDRQVYGQGLHPLVPHENDNKRPSCKLNDRRCR